jgi:hypothetical protein
MAMVFILGQMAANSREIGIRIRLLDMEYIIGKMGESIMDTGKKIICMDKVITNGQMAVSMKEGMLMIKKTAMEYIIIRMEDLIKVCGKMVNSMERVYL